MSIALLANTDRFERAPAVLAYLIAALSPSMDVANAALPAYVVSLLFFVGLLIRSDSQPRYWHWYAALPSAASTHNRLAYTTQRSRKFIQAVIACLLIVVALQSFLVVTEFM